MLLICAFILTVIHCTHGVNYAHLCGYNLTATTFTTCTVLDVIDCADLCDVTDGCIGFNYDKDTYDCNIYDSIRAAGENDDDCGYYIETTASSMIISERPLSEIDQLVQNIVYASQGKCPDGWTIVSFACALNMSAETCNEYASFFSAVFNNETGLCTMPIIGYETICPDASWTLQSFSDGTYCYQMIPRPGNNGASYLEQAKSACAQHDNSNLASIHSQAENNFIFSMQPAGIGNAQAIGLIAASGVIEDGNSMSWVDGSSVTFTNWGGLPERTPNFQLTLMLDDSLWHTSYPSFANYYAHVACKMDAIVLRVVLPF